MQLIQLLIGLSLATILATQATSLWDSPRHRQGTQQLIGHYRLLIREAQQEAVTSGQSVRIPTVDSPLQWTLSTLAGGHIKAYPDGTISPGTLTICNTGGSVVVTLSSLGRIHSTQTGTPCDLPATGG